MLSSVCQPGLEETAAAAKTVRVFQLYVRGDDAWVDDFVRRAKANGYCAFCLTVDVAMYSRRERDLLGRFIKPWRAPPRRMPSSASSTACKWSMSQITADVSSIMAWAARRCCPKCSRRWTAAPR